MNTKNRRAERASNTIRVRETQESQIPLILAWENSELHVTHWSVAQHQEAIGDPNVLHHLIFAKKAEMPVGYAILRKNSPEETSVEFLRLVIRNESKSRGYGSLYFEFIWNLVFSDPVIQRIWHDVFADNHYAVRLYEKLGYSRFKEGLDPASGRALFFYELTRQSYFARMV